MPSKYDAAAIHPGDGPILTSDDFLYQPEKILELRGLSSELRQSYLRAITQELSGCADKGVWTLSVLPRDRKAIPTRLVLKAKYHADGSFDRYKARCVVKGFLARAGIDFWATYSPTTMMSTGRTLMALAVKHKL